MKSNIKFQFHSGLIKRFHVYTMRRYVSLFQFHSGLIKRAWEEVVKSAPFEFQFHSGLIKSFFAFLLFVLMNFVSIPFWSD